MNTLNWQKIATVKGPLPTGRQKGQTACVVTVSDDTFPRYSMQLGFLDESGDFKPARFIPSGRVDHFIETLRAAKEVIASDMKAAEP